MSIKDKALVVFNESSSLHQNPCIGVCSLTYFSDKVCQGCGRSAEDVYGNVEKNVKPWMQKSEVEKKLIIIDAWENGYYPRQRLEHLAEKSNISLNQARKIIEREQLSHVKKPFQERA